MADNKTKKKGFFSRIAGVLIAASMGFGAIGIAGYIASDNGGEVYAKDIGKKNKQACDNCKSVISDPPTPPKARDYSSKVAGTSTNNDQLYGITYNNEGDEKGYSKTAKEYRSELDGAVYVGGNSLTALQSQSSLDQDPIDFGQVLPYGNVYIDAEKLKWGEGKDYIIDIKSKHFKWITPGKELMDAAGNKSSNTYKEYDSTTGDVTVETALKNGTDAIAYIGPLKSYLTNITDQSSHKGTTNVFTAEDESIEYLYQITYKDVATLPDGTKGDLVLTVTSIKIESSFGVDEDHPYTNESSISFHQAVVGVQSPNELMVAPHYQDKNGNYINQQNAVVKTIKKGDANNGLYKEGDKEGYKESKDGTLKEFSDSFYGEKLVDGAVGAIVDLDFHVLDKDGKKVKGSISYAANDLDYRNFQDLWGRSLGIEEIDDDGDGIVDRSVDHRYDFNESFTIRDGSLSYAVVPEYDHANETTRNSGWVSTGPGEAAKSHPLQLMEGTKNNDADGPADGVRLSSLSVVKLRDKNGNFTDSVYNIANSAANNAHRITTVQGNFTNGDNAIVNSNLDSNTRQSYVRQQLYGKIKYTEDDATAGLIPAGFSVGDYVPASNTYMTDTIIFNYLDNTSWQTNRNDEETNSGSRKESFDTGFALLLDASGSSLTWSASASNRNKCGTNLFRTTIFTEIEQSHGTGGGIYTEGYDLLKNCGLERNEGTVTMGKGRGVDATVTAVPEDGYRVRQILVGGEVLSDSKTYTVIYDTNGNATGITDDNGDAHNFVNNKVSVDNIEFEINPDGPIDVTLNNLEDTRHVHVDFETDYFFYKVWVGGSEPVDLELTATPYAFKFHDVTIKDVNYSIDSMPGEDDDGAYSHTLKSGSDTWHVRDNVLTIGRDDNKRLYRLVGNSFIETEPNSSGQYSVYDINLEYVQNGSAVHFTVTKADAENTEESNVVQETDSEGNIVWKIRYPSEGYKTKAGEVWGKTPIETEPTSHVANHVERNYWFVSEDNPDRTLAGYDNTKAEVPGKIEEAKSRGEVYKDSTGSSEDNYTAWATASVKDYAQAKKKIEDAENDGHAYMSVFNGFGDSKYSWGGEIANIPVTIVQAEKIWDDENNKYNTRKDLMLHIDAELSDGTRIKDILPAHLISKDDTGDDLVVSWGDENIQYEGYTSAVNTEDCLMKESIPDDSVYDWKTYSFKDGTGHVYGNILPVYDKNGNKITYKVRETNKDWTADKLEGYKTPVIQKNSLKSVKNPATGVETTYYDVGNEMEKNPPTPVNYETWGLKGETQEGHPLFNKGSFEISNVQLIDPSTGNPTDAETIKAFDESGNEIGTYTLHITSDGTVTVNFKPEPYYKGTPKPAKLRASDKYGQTAYAEYQPHVEDNMETKTVSRDISYKYIDEKGKEASKTVTQTVTFTRVATSLDPDTHKPVWGDWEHDEDMPEVVSPEIKGWIPDTAVVDAFDVDSIDPEDSSTFPDNEIVVYVEPPSADTKKTYGGKGETQKGTPSFEEGTGKLISFILLDPETEEPTDKITVKGEGTYTVDPETGEVTFVPEPEFVGTATTVRVMGTDDNGLTAVGKYIPIVKDNTQIKTVKRTIEYVYDDGTPVTDEKGNPVVEVEKKTFTRTGRVDPDTGKITWEAWAPQSYDDIESKAKVPSGVTNRFKPDQEIVDGHKVTPADGDEYIKVVYSRRTFTVTYLDGMNGKSTGGDESGKEYDSHPGRINTVSPNDGYVFTGTYSYIIYLADGTTVEGTTDDPYSIDIIGDVVFTPIYETTQPTEPSSESTEHTETSKETEKSTDPTTSKSDTNNKKNAPETGDSSDYSVWFVLAVASVVIALTVYVFGRKKTRRIRK